VVTSLPGEEEKTDAGAGGEHKGKLVEGLLVKDIRES
jgi:hypothetical protein